MAGHSKWSNIKHKKAIQDNKKGKVFTKLIREITVSSRLAGGNINSNPRLRTAVSTALNNNMHKDTIERAIKKGIGTNSNDLMEELKYEGYGPSGVAIIISCITNNRNRTISEIRGIFSKFGGKLGSSGSVSYMFEKKGVINIINHQYDEDSIIKMLLEIEIDDILINKKNIKIITSSDNLFKVNELLLSKGFNPSSTEYIMQPNIKNKLENIDIIKKILKMMSVLENLDDVQTVYNNLEIDRDIERKLENDHIRY